MAALGYTYRDGGGGTSGIYMLKHHQGCATKLQAQLSLKFLGRPILLQGYCKTRTRSFTGNY